MVLGWTSNNRIDSFFQSLVLLTSCVPRYQILVELVRKVSSDFNMVPRQVGYHFSTVLPGLIATE